MLKVADADVKVAKLEEDGSCGLAVDVVEQTVIDLPLITEVITEHMGELIVVVERARTWLDVGIGEQRLFVVVIPFTTLVTSEHEV